MTPTDDALAEAAWSQLVEAMEDTEPACLDDTRFTLDVDDLHPQERRHLREICETRCQLLDQCDTYAQTARPRAGIWAGKNYTPTTWRKNQP